MYYVYILYSSTIDKYYIGYTADTNSRLYKHNAKHKGFTGQVDDWVIMYEEQLPTKQEAMQREKQLKGWKSRKALESLIRSAG